MFPRWRVPAAGASLTGRAVGQFKNHQISFIQNSVHAVLQSSSLQIIKATS